MTRISLVIPLYGASPHAGEALKSACENLTECDEIIAVLDRATEDLRQEIERIPCESGPTLIMVDSQGEGITNALITGCATAKGHFIFRLDGDDVMLPGRVEKQLKIFERSPSTLAVGGQARLINKDGEFMGKTYLPLRSWQIEAQAKLSNPLIHPAMAYRAEAIQAVGGYSPLHALAQDYDLAVRLMSIGKIENLKEEVISYRVHPEQISSSRRQERIPFVADTLLAANRGKLSQADALRIATLLSMQGSGSAIGKAFALYFLKRPLSACTIAMAQMSTRVNLFLSKTLRERK